MLIQEGPSYLKANQTSSQERLPHESKRTCAHIKYRNVFKKRLLDSLKFNLSFNAIFKKFFPPQGINLFKIFLNALMNKPKKIVIIGGVAAGASAAARLRRLDESAQIIMLERGEYVSYANCGLPYHIGGIIADRNDLIVTKPEKFSNWFNIEVRTSSEVVAIDRANKRVLIKNKAGEYSESYDSLIIATGASAFTSKTDGDENSKIRHLWTMSDMDGIIGALKDKSAKVTIVGGGFIGLETAENLRHRGVGVTLIQRSGHVLPVFDGEMALPLTSELIEMGVNVILGRTVKKYEDVPDGIIAILDNGERVFSNIVISSTGIKPNSALALESGIECSKDGFIKVDEHMRTSDENIYAAGDVVEIDEPIFNSRTHIPLAGPANKQGRIVADNIAGIRSSYRGTYGASVVKLGKLTAASVGMTEKRLKSAGKEYLKIYIHPSSSASYYPGAARMDMKLLFGADGTIYGAQIIGQKGVDKRIDSISQAMFNGLKADMLGALELSYAPPFSSAKDPVNYLGFVASNVLSGKSTPAYADEMPADAIVLDVREPSEVSGGKIPNSINIPLGQLRTRLSELDKSRLIVASCQVGLRGYLAERILKQNGFNAANLSGGYLTWKAVNSK